MSDKKIADPNIRYCYGARCPEIDTCPYYKGHYVFEEDKSYIQPLLCCEKADFSLPDFGPIEEQWKSIREDRNKMSIKTNIEHIEEQLEDIKNMDIKEYKKSERRFKISNFILSIAILIVDAIIIILGWNNILVPLAGLKEINLFEAVIFNFWITYILNIYFSDSNFDEPKSFVHRFFKLLYLLLYSIMIAGLIFVLCLFL